MSSSDSVYITLQYLRTTNGVNKFHWGLYITESHPPSGHLLRATDADSRPGDLHVESQRVKDPRKLTRMVACLKIAGSPGMAALEYAASAVPLMDDRCLPRGESQWTSRVWVKEVLNLLERKRYIRLPADLDTIEEQCLHMGDKYLSYMGSAKVYDDMGWLSSLGPRASEAKYDSYYGTKAMVADTYY
ncbi:hypothetical protein VTG60DRAFT_6573 [Thermothelomyces hinnuleus]